MIICVHHVDVVFVCVVECGGQFRGRGTSVSPPNLCRRIIMLEIHQINGFIHFITYDANTFSTTGHSDLYSRT